MNELLYGLVTGILFGFFLQKAQVIRYDNQLGALRLQDFTIVKFMLAHIAVAMVGVYLLYDLGLVKLNIKATILGGVVVGGLIFGIGWGLIGYCPGTSLGAVGEGRYDGLAGILGMLVGAGLYAEAFPFLSKTVLTWGNYGKITIPQVLQVNHWVVIVVLLALFAWLCYFIERWEATKRPTRVMINKSGNTPLI